MANSVEDILDKLSRYHRVRIRKGIEGGLIQIDPNTNRVYFPKQGKDYEFIGQRIIQASLYVELVLPEYGYKYPPGCIGFEIMPPRRVPKEPADMVIYRDSERKEAFAAIECEATSEKSKLEEAKREGLGKANNFRADWLITACGEDLRFYNLEESAPPSPDQLEDCRKPTFPAEYGQPVKCRYRKGKPLDLHPVDMKELQKRFRTCHDEIWEGGKRDPAQAYDEMSKLLFAKMHDELFTEVSHWYDFQVCNGEDEKEVAEKVHNLYNKARKGEPDVFGDGIELSAPIIQSVVKILQDVSLASTDLDAKGKAFETFLGKMFRGEYGQYFTPREIVEFMVDMTDPDPRELCIDPACGSGGFLLYCMKYVGDVLKKKYQSKSTIDRIYWDFTHQNVYGIEINKRIARIAMMDMVLHEDGHTNIEGGGDGLDFYKNYDSRRSIKPSKYSVVLTNPPFGDEVKKDKKKYYKTYELTKKKSGEHTKKEKTEILFIERCIDLMEPEKGRVGMVLPNGILNNRSWGYRNTRRYILENTKVSAIIELPDFTFRPYGSNVKPSLVFLESLKHEEENYPVFMAVAEKIGYNSIGVSDENRLPEIYKQYKEFRKDPKEFKETQRCFKVSSEKLKRRMDPTYYRNRKFVEPEVDKLHSQFEKMAEVERPQIDPGKTPHKKFNFVSLKDINEEEGRIVKWHKVFGIQKKGQKIRFRKGYIIMARIEPSVLKGNVAIAPDECNEYIGSGELFVIRPKEGVDKNYLFWLLRSKFFYKQAKDRLTGTTGRQRLNREYFKEMVFPNPPLEIQKEIGRNFSKMRESRKQLLGEADDLRNEMFENAYEKLESL